MARIVSGDELIPSARRLVKSLRDLGYDFVAAVADLIDNSIAARASLVAVDVEFDGDDSWVRIADNGKGMTPAELREAMRYGSERAYDERDLGKFGLGLKTASLSQCQRLTVASRTNPSRADITSYSWDLDHIERTNRWQILADERSSLGPAIRNPLKESTGTVVIWQRLDRILGYKHPYNEFARKRLSMMCRDLELHLGMVFHRFLSGTVRSRKLKILINGNTVTPWDPFARDEAKTKGLTPVTIRVEHEGILSEVKLEPFVLPHQQDFSSPDAFRRASGPANWNQQQGFYIYRGDRLIQSGGWCRIRTMDEHSKLARVAMSFLPTLDEAFKINVAKMRVQLPPSIREQVDRAIKPVIKIAQETYRKNSSSSPIRPPSNSGTSTGSSSSSAATHGVSAGSAPSAATVHDRPDGEASERLWTIDELQRELELAAESDERPIVKRVFKRFRARLGGAGESR